MTDTKRKFVRKPVILVVAVLALAGIAGLFCTVAYAQSAGGSALSARPNTCFDPFILNRILITGTGDGGGVVLANNGNGPPSANGFPGPPVFVPGRPSLRSSVCPPFGWAWGRNGE